MKIGSILKSRSMGQMVSVGICGGLFVVGASVAYVLLRGVESYPPLLFWAGMGVSLLLCLVAVAGLFLGPEFRINSITVVLSSLTFAYLLELALFGLALVREDAEAIDHRSGLEVIQAHRARGEELWSWEMPPIQLQDQQDKGAGLFALSGVSNARILTCNETGEWFSVSTDQHGFNNPPFRPGTNFEAVILGDSFAHGGCAGAGKDVGTSLRRLGASVRNLGIQGAGPLFTLAILREYAAAHRPRVVFWLYYEGNDLADLLEESRIKFLQEYLKPGHFNNLAARQDAIDQRIRQFQTDRLQTYAGWRSSRAPTHIWSLLKLENLRRSTGLLGYQLDKTIVERNRGIISEMFSASVRAMTEATEGWGGKIVFVYIPDGARYDRINTFDYLRDEVLSIVRQSGATVADFQKHLEQLDDPRTAYNRTNVGGLGHLSGIGNEMLAQFLVLEANRLGVQLSPEKK